MCVCVCVISEQLIILITVTNLFFTSTTCSSSSKKPVCCFLFFYFCCSCCHVTIQTLEGSVPVCCHTAGRHTQLWIDEHDLFNKCLNKTCVRLSRLLVVFITAVPPSSTNMSRIQSNKSIQESAEEDEEDTGQTQCKCFLFLLNQQGRAVELLSR